MSLINSVGVNSSLAAMAAYDYGTFQPGVLPPVLTPVPNIKNLHPREIEAQNYFGKEILELDPTDLRPKALYLVSSSDDTVFSFAPIKQFLDTFGFQSGSGSKPHLETLNKTHDVLYRMISSFKEICPTITAGAKTGKITTLVLFAHGDSDGISLPDQSLNRFDQRTIALMDGCFSQLDEQAEISLLSCATGRYPDSIASIIAQLADRTVWAPETSVTPSATEFSLSIPSRPTFSTIYSTKDLACKFSREGVRTCNQFEGNQLLKDAFHPPLERVIARVSFYVFFMLNQALFSLNYHTQRSPHYFRILLATSAFFSFDYTHWYDQARYIYQVVVGYHLLTACYKLRVRP